MTADPASKPFLRALSGDAVDPPPVWLMRQAGRYLPEYRAVRSTVSGFLELCYSPDKATEVTLQPLRRYAFDAAILFSDILVVPHALGASVSFREGEGPSLEVIRTAADLDGLQPNGFLERLEPVFETVRRLATAIPPSTALIGFAGAPWTVATYMVDGNSGSGFVGSKSMAFRQPELFGRLIDLLVEATASYLLRQVENGAEALQLFDSWAGVLDEEAFGQWVIEPTRRVVERIKASHPDLPIIGFPRAAGVLYEAFAERTGVDAVSLDPSVPLDWAVRRLRPHVALQGNLDPIRILAGGPALDAAIDRILAVCRGGPFVFNAGHGLLPETPPENVARLVDRVRGKAR